MKPELYIGAMTGTSMDGLDLALVEFLDNSHKTIAAKTFPLPAELIQICQQLCSPKTDCLDNYGIAHRWLGECTAQAILQLLAEVKVSPNQITAIGSHGQTVRHRPDFCHPFTLQLGDGATIAEQTGIDTITDFRSADIAAGGQGAPLVPAFHAYLLGKQTEPTVIVNIGGISNITYLATNGEVLGYDTGPGNTLLDLWCQQHTGKKYDKNGEWGASGKASDYLLKNLLQDEYFKRPYPKSTGREYFNLNWLNTYLSANANIPTQDIQNTLHILTAQTISAEILTLAQTCNVYICGGGTHNNLLMKMLKKAMPQNKVSSLAAIGIEPDQVESTCFAWLAKCYINRIAANIPQTTGANKSKILGALHIG